MIVFPNAKINLGLNIVSKRTDGYHNIETVFYPIPLCDALEIVPAKGDKGILRQTGIAIEGNPKHNLVCKAYRLLKETYSLPEIDTYLLKKIPSGAGLGGGSSDAAFMLKLLNEWGNLNLPLDTLEEYASRLGADCAFFVRNEPVFAEGIGNRFTPVSLSLQGYHLVLIKPPVFVPTQDAYATCVSRLPDQSIKEILQEPVETWKRQLVNDFEKSVFRKYPMIGSIKQQLYDKGAVYASMSGSGSSVFGLFQEDVILDSHEDTFQLKIIL